MIYTIICDILATTAVIALLYGSYVVLLESERMIDEGKDERDN